MSDSISRKAAKIIIAGLPAYHGSEGAWIHQKDALDAIDRLPSDDPDRRSGEWLLITKSSGLFSGYRCSECNELVYVATNFCPNCGERMKGR